MYLLAYYVPGQAAGTVAKALFAAGAGAWGHYDQCLWETTGTSQFRPLAGAKPQTGEPHRLHRDEEHKVEMLVPGSRIRAVLDALWQHHPYEEPAFHVMKLDVLSDRRRFAAVFEPWHDQGHPRAWWTGHGMRTGWLAAPHQNEARSHQDWHRLSTACWQLLSEALHHFQLTRNHLVYLEIRVHAAAPADLKTQFRQQFALPRELVIDEYRDHQDASEIMAPMALRGEAREEP
jgi:hypothetical protein